MTNTDTTPPRPLADLTPDEMCGEYREALRAAVGQALLWSRAEYLRGWFYCRFAMQGGNGPIVNTLPVCHRPQMEARIIHLRERAG